MPPYRAIAPFVGLNTQENESILLPTEGTIVSNFNLDRGTIKRRDGWSQISATSSIDTGAILGLYDFRRLSGSSEYTTNTLIKSGQSLWRRKDGNLAKIGDNVLTANTLADFASFEDVAYIADAGKFKATDGETVYDAIIPKPQLVPAASANGVGVLTGRYDWKYTWYSPTYKQESASSAASTAGGYPSGSAIGLVLSDNAVQLTNLPTNTVGSGTGGSPVAMDARESAWIKRIYRRNATLGQSNWLLVGTASAAATTFDDNVEDHLVSNTEVAPLSSQVDMEGIRNIEEHRGVMFMAFDDDRLFFSKPEQPWSVTEYFSVGGDSERGKITGLLSWRGVLYVFKEESIWAVDGLTKDQMTARPIVTGVGCYSGHSIVADNKGVYFLGEDAFYVFDGQSAIAISDPVKPTVNSRNRSRDRFVVGASDQENRSIIWTYSSAGSSTNDKCLVFFEGNSNLVERPSWANWEFNSPVNYVERITTDDTTADRVLWYGFQNGKVGNPNPTGGDDGNPILSEWTTGKIDMGEPTRHKAWTTIYIEQEKQPSYSGLSIWYFIDKGDVPGFLDEINSQNPINYLRIRERARDIKIKFLHSDTEPIDMSVFTIDAHLAGIYHRES